MVFERFPDVLRNGGSGGMRIGVAVVASLLAILTPSVGARAQQITRGCPVHADQNQVFFATDRQWDPGLKTFGRERNFDAAQRPVIAYGVAEYGQNPSKVVCDEADFFARLSGAAVNARDGILFYTHGYHTAFDDALADSNTLHLKLLHQGPVVAFSFPAQTRGFPVDQAQYINDETQASWSTPHFVQLLNQIHQEFPNLQMTFLADSLGARLLSAGIRRAAALGSCGAGPCLRHAAVFGGDIDTFELRETFDAVESCDSSPSRRRFFAYVSRRDEAVGISRTLHGHSRAGTANSANDAHRDDELFLCGSVETIDITQHHSTQISPVMDATGHFYYKDDVVLADLQLAFAGVAPTDASRGLQQLIEIGPLHRPYFLFTR